MMVPDRSFAYVLTVVAGPAFGGRAWQLASNRLPTTAEAVAHIADEVARMEGPDRAFGRACLAILEEHGVPENYRAGSQGAALAERSGPSVELALMRFLELAYLEEKDL